MSNDITFCSKPNCPKEYRESCRRADHPQSGVHSYAPFEFDPDVCYWCKDTHLDAMIYKPKK